MASRDLPLVRHSQTDNCKISIMIAIKIIVCFIQESETAYTGIVGYIVHIVVFIVINMAGRVFSYKLDIKVEKYNVLRD